MTRCVNGIRFEKKSSDVGHYWRSDAPKFKLLAHIRNLTLTTFKEASIGGEQESGFESAFSSLAYAYIKDKSPRLIDFLIGFQLVDRNEDNTKAIGVFGFHVGDQWLYAPVFFLNGDLKGHELLYMKKSDTFVPMKENWVNYIISRKPHILGEGSARNTQQLGGMMPNFQRMIHPPHSAKFGSDNQTPNIDAWAKPFVGFMATVGIAEPFTGKGYDRVFHKQAGLNERLDLREFLSSDINLLKIGFDAAEKYPLIKKGFDRFYGKDFFLKCAEKLKRDETCIVTQAKKAAATAKPTRRAKLAAESWSLLPVREEAQWVHPIKSGALRVYVYEGLQITQNLKDLDEDEREKLLNDTVLIKDERDPHAVSTAYNTQVRAELTNPTQTGLYDVLEKPGETDEMLIVYQPYTNKGRESFSTVVRKGDAKNWLNTHSTNVWVQQNKKPDQTEYETWFKSLSDSSSMEKGGTYLILGENGTGTTPFVVREILDDGGYRVDFKRHCEYGRSRPKNLPSIYGHSHGHYDDMESSYISSYDALLFINRKKGCSLRAVAGELSVPETYKVMKLSDPPKPKKDDNLFGCGCGDMMEDDSSSEKRPIRPGDLGDVQTLLFEKTASIKLIDMRSEVCIKSPMGNQVLQKKAALVSLVRDHGFHEAAAREMMQQADTKGSAVYRVKYAQGFGPMMPNMGGGPGAPAFPPQQTGTEQIGYGSVQSQYPYEEEMPVEGMQSSDTDPSVYDPFFQPDQKSMQVAQQASQSGQKEVFDTAMIGSMLKAVRQDSIVDRYLGDLMKALDKLGRILFMFYWHQEEFEDRYGKQDLPELEDSLRNAFEVLGDVVLFLKEKSVGGMDDFGGVGNAEPNIEEAARN